MKTPTNIGVSARNRLTKLARERRENAQLLMTRYAIERVLYRLSVSRHKDRFILKGAMLFSLWAPNPLSRDGRPGSPGTRDNAPDAIAAVFSEILAIPADDEWIEI